jgi:hypothetical protein
VAANSPRRLFGSKNNFALPLRLKA